MFCFWNKAFIYHLHKQLATIDDEISCKYAKIYLLAYSVIYSITPKALLTNISAFATGVDKTTIILQSWVPRFDNL